MPDGAQRLPVFMTAEEFLEWEGNGAKYQLVDGELREMSPASETHGLIQLEIGHLIRSHLIKTDSSYRVLTEAATQPRIRGDINVRIPDLAVTAAPPMRGRVAIEQAILLVEVLSAGNAKDTWDNVWTYPTIPTVQEILIVSSYEIAAQILCRDTDGNWPKVPTQLASGDTLKLESIGLEVPLDALYAQTFLAPGASA